LLSTACRLCSPGSLDTEQITKEQAEAYLGNPTIGQTRTPLVRTWESVMGKTDPKTLEGKKPKKYVTIYIIQIMHNARIKKIIKNFFFRFPGREKSQERSKASPSSGKGPSAAVSSPKSHKGK
jgi:hypothetical protein